MRPKPPSFLKDGVAEGEVPRAPPPITPADLSVASNPPGPSVASTPLAQLMASEQTTLSALDLLSLGDATTSALACSLFIPGTADFHEDTEPIQVWRMLQFLGSVQQASARLLAGLFVSSVLRRRDHVLASAPTLSADLKTSLRLAPISNTSLFGPAAQSAATASSQETQQRAFHAMVSLASSQASRGNRGSGSRSSRGRGSSAAPTTSNPSTHSHRGRGGSKRGGRGRGSGRGKQAAAGKPAASSQPPPQ